MDRHRTLVRVHALVNDDLYLVIPAWDPILPVKIKLSSVPENARDAIKSNKKRMHAVVDLGADDASELGFDNWEVD